MKEAVIWQVFYKENLMLGGWTGTMSGEKGLKGWRENNVYMVQKTFVEVILIFPIPSFPINSEPLEWVFEFSISLRIILFSDLK